MHDEGKKTLLLVEDEALIALAEKNTLEHYGYRVKMARHGEEAVSVVKNTPGIDLILMDINLGPGIDGTEAAALILKDHDLPVLFLSSHTEPQVVEKTEKITSYGYVVKDSSGTVLDASIKMAFKLFEAKVREKKKEEDLRQSEEILRYIVRHDPNAIAVFDRGLTYIAVSNRYLQDYSVREKDILGRHHYDVFPEMPQRWKDVHQRCLAGAIERSDDDFFERPDGSITYNRWECRPWYRMDGEIGGIITYTEVTTERKLAELKLAQNLDMLTKLACLVPGVIYQYRLDPDGRSAFPYSSPGMNDIYEVAPEDVREDATPVFGRLHPDDFNRVSEAIAESARTLKTFYCDFRVNLPRQGIRWRWSQAQPERLPDGGTLWHGIIQDVTERTLREQALRESEERYRAIVDASPDAILLTSPEGSVLKANASACHLFGWTEEEMIRGGRDLILDVRDPRLASGLEERARTGNFHGTLTFIRKSGERFPGEISSIMFKDKDGNTRTSMIIRDVTESERAANALRVSEEQFRTLATLAPIGIYLTDTQGRCRYANARWLEMAGLSLEEALGDGWIQGLHPADREAVFASWQKTVESEGRWGLEYRFQDPGGRVTWVQGLAAPERDAAGNIVGYIGVNVDINERKQAEGVRRSAENRFRLLFEQSPDGIVILDPETMRILEFNGTACRQLGYSCEEFAGLAISDIEAVETPEDTRVRVDSVLREGVIEFETLHRTKQGDIRNVLVRAQSTISDGRRIYHCIWRDITDNRRAAEALRVSEQRLHDVLFSMADWVWEVDSGGRYTYSSERGERLFGLSTEDIIGKTPFDLMPPEEAARVAPIFSEIADRKGIIKDLENWNIGRDGERILLLTNGVPLLDADGNLKGYRGVDQDITGRKRVEMERQVLLEIALSMLVAKGLPEFLRQVQESISKVIFAENFFVALYNKATGMFEEVYSVDEIDGSFPPSRLEKSISKHVFRTGRPLLCTPENFEKLAARGEVELVGAPSPSWLGAPLKTANETIGVMVVQDYHREDRYSQRDLDLFATIAGQVALAVDYKRTEEELKRQLDEKGLLLKEVLHRVKNNIVSIGSLISLQMRTTSNPETLAILQDVLGRINSIHILYDKLLASASSKDISVKNYVESLASAVVSLYPDRARIQLELDVADFELDSKRLFPLGIIINELLTNIMKYAFPGKKSGRIRLSLAKTANRVSLILQDDGGGLPEGFEVRDSTGFGLTLVQMLSEQLGGSFTLGTHAGTRATLAFDV